jgi:hypothetical protein
LRVLYSESRPSGRRRVSLELSPRLRIMENGVQLHEGPSQPFPGRAFLFLQITGPGNDSIRATIFEDVSAQ